jgi:hypothetical protein
VPYRAPAVASFIAAGAGDRRSLETARVVSGRGIRPHFVLLRDEGR